MTAVLHPVRIVRPLPPGVHVGAGVGYRGRRTAEHYSTFYVVEVDEATNLLTLTDRDYPSVTTLHNVHPSTVRPTGQTISTCAAAGMRRAGPGAATATAGAKPNPATASYTTTSETTEGMTP